MERSKDAFGNFDGLVCMTWRRDNSHITRLGERHRHVRNVAIAAFEPDVFVVPESIRELFLDRAHAMGVAMPIAYSSCSSVAQEPGSADIPHSGQ
jgi:hypothetical protein